MPIKIKWSPTPVEEVVQCVETILATEPGTAPMARALGTPQDIVDQPQSVAGAALSAAAIAAVRRYEPRVKITGVKLAVTPDGKLSAVATLGAP